MGAKPGAARAGRATDTGDMQLGYWVVAFIDILGFRSALKALSCPPPSPPQDSPQAQALRDAAIKVINTRRNLVGVVKNFMKHQRTPLHSPVPTTVPKRWRGVAKSWRNVQIGMANFSDSVMFSVSLTPSGQHVLSMRAINTVLIACCGAMLFQLARGHDNWTSTLPVRGGIDVDFGIEAADHPIDGDPERPPVHLYSAAGAIAYDLESTVAEYPRIIASEKFMELLETFATPQEDHPTIKANLGFARKNQQFFVRDLDGAATLDFLGPAFRDAAPDTNLTEFVRQAWTFAKAAHAAHREAGSVRLARKYVWLANYIHSRLDVWGIKA